MSEVFLSTLRAGLFLEFGVPLHKAGIAVVLTATFSETSIFENVKADVALVLGVYVDASSQQCSVCKYTIVCMRPGLVSFILALYMVAQKPSFPTCGRLQPRFISPSTKAEKIGLVACQTLNIAGLYVSACNLSGRATI